MNCNPILMEALDGINFSYKLDDDTLSELNQNKNLSRKILPDIKKKLSKQVLKLYIKVDKYIKYNDNNIIYVIDISKTTNKPIKWSIYSILASLGLTQETNETK